MTRKNTKKHILIVAAAAIAAPALFSLPAAAEGGYADYRYRTVLATETQQEKTKRTAAQTRQQAVLAGTFDSARSDTSAPARTNHFRFDVALDEEQHYRE